MLVAVAVVASVTHLLVGNPFDPLDNKRFSAGSMAESQCSLRYGSSCPDVSRSDQALSPARYKEKRVVTLLGPPVQIEDGQGSEHDRLIGTRFYRYHIGNLSFQRGRCVHFDSQDRVIKTAIYGY